MENAFYFRDVEKKRMRYMLDRYGSCIIGGVHGVGKTTMVENYIEENKIESLNIDCRQYVSDGIPLNIALATTLDIDLTKDNPIKYRDIFRKLESIGTVIVFDELDAYKKQKYEFIMHLDSSKLRNSKVIAITLDLNYRDDSDDGSDRTSSKQYNNRLFIRPFDRVQTGHIFKGRSVKESDKLLNLVGGLPALIGYICNRKNLGESIDIDLMMVELDEYFQNLYNLIEMARMDEAAIDYLGQKYLGRGVITHGYELEFSIKALLRRFSGFGDSSDIDTIGSTILMSELFELWVLENKIGIFMKANTVDRENGSIIQRFTKYGKEIDEFLKVAKGLKKRVISLVL